MDIFFTSTKLPVPLRDQKFTETLNDMQLFLFRKPRKELLFA